MTMSKLGAAILGVALVLAVAIGVRTMVFGQVRTEKLPAPAMDEPQGATHKETAVFAGGCFWGVQTTFQRIKGYDLQPYLAQFFEPEFTPEDRIDGPV